MPGKGVETGSAPAQRPTLRLERRRTARTAGTALPLRRRARFGLVVADAVALLGALAVMGSIRPEIQGLSVHILAPMAVAVVAQIVVFAAVGLYRLWRMPAWDEVRRMVGATAIWVIVVAIATPWWSGAVSRSFLLYTWLIALAFLFPMRGVVRWALSRAKTKEEAALRTAVVGPNGEAGSMVSGLSGSGEIAPVGYIAMNPGDTHSNGLPVLGTLQDLGSIIVDKEIECLLLPATGLSEDEILRVSRACRRASIELKVWSELPDILGSRLAIQPMDGRVALALEPVHFTSTQAALKRSFDLVTASLSLLVLLPFLALIGLAIRLTSRGPVLFRQPRVTKDGRVFTMYKFRTMVSELQEALEIDLTQPFFKMREDPRLTKVGRMLRSLSLDELPQLLNVILGDMSMVGPRPLPVEQIEANAEFFAPRHEVRGGITGWWQISGRSALDSRRALRRDLWYIENWSLGLDVYILIRTLGAVIARRGAW
ncbi:MAG TPA: sugar transferase [Actinomycetota bacterium]